jgi:hypothetical protein
MTVALQNVFNALYQAREASQHAQDLTGRVVMPVLGIVTENNDPTGARRIKISDPAAPAINSDWIRRALDRPNYDPPLPKIGSTVLVAFIDGDPLNGWYSVCQNLTNAPLQKANPIIDLAERVEGDTTERTDGDRIIDVGRSLTLRTDSGSRIELAADGSITLIDSSGNTLSLDGAISFDTSSLTVGSKEIATVDAVDTAGHALVNKGWS